MMRTRYAWWRAWQRQQRLRVVAPYHPALPERMKRLGGRWDPAASAWLLDPRDEERASALLVEGGFAPRVAPRATRARSSARTLFSPRAGSPRASPRARRVRISATSA